MRIIDAALYLEFNEMVDCGIKGDTIKKAKWRGTPGWYIIKDNRDNRKVLIAFDPLSDEYKAKITAKYGDPYQYFHRQVLLGKLFPDVKGEEIIDNYRTPHGIGLPLPYIKKCKTALRILQFLNKPKEGKRRDVFEACIELIKDHDLPLPATYNNLTTKVKQYRELKKDDPTGYSKMVISGKYGNNNSKKLSDEAEHWLICRYAAANTIDVPALTVLYNSIAEKNNWNPVTERSLRGFLYRKDVEIQWYAGRHGMAAWRARFARTGKLFLPIWRDSIWCMDGTKLNFYYRTENGQIAAKLQINKIIDVYSEVILGYDIMEHEDHVSAYKTLKAAIKFAGCKPYQVLYDNQGGYRKHEIQGILSNISSIHFPAMPYNSTSKSVESVIGRFQAQHMKQYWFFTGQNITAKSRNSRSNIEFIQENAHKLPTRDQLMIIIEKLIKDWNLSTHPVHGEPRLDLYLKSVNPDHSPVTAEDMINTFYLQKKQAVTYYPHGITIEVQGKRLDYEVYDAAGLPDAAFLNKFTRAKFIVMYDPDELSHIRLCMEHATGELGFVAVAEIKRAHARAVQDLKYHPGMRSEIDQFIKAKKERESLVKAQAQKHYATIDPTLLMQHPTAWPKHELEDANDDLVLSDRWAQPINQKKDLNDYKEMTPEEWTRYMEEQL